MLEDSQHLLFPHHTISQRSKESWTWELSSEKKKKGSNEWKEQKAQRNLEHGAMTLQAAGAVDNVANCALIESKAKRHSILHDPPSDPPLPLSQS